MEFVASKEIGRVQQNDTLFLLRVGVIEPMARLYLADVLRTCQRLWEAIPEEYQQGHCFTDFLKVYASVIPMEQHTAVGKETRETAHVGR